EFHTTITTILDLISTAEPGTKPKLIKILESYRKMYLLAVSPPPLIHDLPTLPLKLIFSRLSLGDQLKNLWVCGRFRSVQLELFRSRRDLVLLIGSEESVDQSNSLHLKLTRQSALWLTRIFPNVTTLQF